MAKRKKARIQSRRQSVGKAKSSGNSSSVKKLSPGARQSETIPAKNNRQAFYVVGIGASAGGLEAFEQFFSHMPADSGMAFVLIPHLDPTHKSILADLLKRYTTMEISQAEDGMKVKPDTVFIIPPNKDMSILHGTLQLLEPAEGRGLRHPIDFFFRSLAEDWKEKAVSIVLSGTGTEGAQGLKAVKGEGGLVLAQDVKTAKYDGMPASAIATGLVDYVLPPDKMPGHLLRYIRRPHPGPFPPAEKPEGKAHDFLQKIYVLIRAQTGHDFSLYKQNTIVRRIEKRMAIHQIEGLSDYVAYLRSSPHEVEALFKELLIRVTGFFRDPEAFEVVKKNILPQVLKNRSADVPLRIWVPGCSTGEEAYSLAIMLREYLQKQKKDFRVQIFATDIDDSAIETARAGMYSDSITADVSPEQLARFFSKKGHSFKVKEEIRDMVVFAVQDLIKDPPFSKLDMISCRNLLIYMSSALQKKILPLFYYSLNHNGILFLGSSETIGDHADLFSILDKKWKIFKVKRTTVSAGRVDFPPAALPDAGMNPERILHLKKPGEPGLGELTEKLLLEKYTPACVIMNEKGDILYIHGRTGKYLEPASGKASLNIAEMAREGLRLELKAALRKAVSRNKDVVSGGLQVRTDGGFQSIDLEVRHIKDPEHLRGLIMVVFHERAETRGGGAARLPVRLPEKTQRRIAELEADLKSAKEHLHTTIEELETSNEELKSANEELQSSNEELQSTNEEMETSKEELQSVNEELMTVNAELQSKIDELTQINSDMSNLLAGTQIATVFLADDLRIKRFTPAATDVINLIPSDIGRPIGDIAAKLEYQGLVRDAEEVLRTLAVKETETRCTDGPWYLIRIMPYRTVTNVIDGVVVTFIDITAQKKMQEALREALDFSQGIIETVREPLLVLDEGFRVVSANDSFYKTFGVSPADTEKRLIYELGNHQWDIPALRNLLERILPENTQFRDFTVDHEFPGIGRRKMLLNARRIAQRGAQRQMILIAMEDITERK